MTREELIGRLKQDEDALVERKTKPDRSGVAETIVAFANSVEPGQEAVLFLGVRPDKTVVGVEALDPRDTRTTSDTKGRPASTYAARPPLPSARNARSCAVVRGTPGAYSVTRAGG